MNSQDIFYLKYASHEEHTDNFQHYSASLIDLFFFENFKFIFIHRYYLKREFIYEIDANPTQFKFLNNLCYSVLFT